MTVKVSIWNRNMASINRTSWWVLADYNRPQYQPSFNGVFFFCKMTGCKLRFVICAVPHSCNYLGNMLNNNKKTPTDCMPFFFFFYRRCRRRMLTQKKMPHLLHLGVSGAFQVWHTTEVDIFSSIFISACAATVASCSRRRAPEPHSFLQKSVTSRGAPPVFLLKCQAMTAEAVQIYTAFCFNHTFVR